MKVISLFSGCGGLDFGFKKEGYNIVFANDFLEDACLSYSQNIDSNIIFNDIYDIKNSDIPKADLIIGGPPCQGFSGAGKRNPSDERSMLVWKFIDIIKDIKPKIFLFENVTGLSSSRAADGTRVINNIIGEFKKNKYDVEILTLNSADYGVPQKRKRIFIVGNNKGLKINYPPITHCEPNYQMTLYDHSSLLNWVSSKEAIGDLSDPTEDGIVEYINKIDNSFLSFVRSKKSNKTNLHYIPYVSDNDKKIIPHIKPGSNYMDIPDKFASKRIKFLKENGGRTTVFGRLHPDKPSYTLNTWFDRPNVGSNIHYEKDRVITIREGLRLQSFPDNYRIISRNKRNFYLQIGNAVPPLLSLAWAKHLKEFL